MTEIINALHQLMAILTNENFPIFMSLVLMAVMGYIGLKLAKAMDKLTIAVTSCCIKMDTIVEFIVKEEKNGQRRDIKSSLLAPSSVV